MAETLRERLQTLESEKDRWFRERGRQVARLVGDAEHLGRQTWNAATRAGVDLAARTPQELRTLGAAVLKWREQPAAAGHGATLAPRAASAAPSSRPRSSTPHAATRPSAPSALSAVGGALYEGALQADTAMRGAANVLTFGGADHLAAGLDALVAPGGIRGWSERYDAILADEQARNLYDANHRATAQHLGQVAGTALGLGLVGPMEGALAAMPRLAGAARLTGREVAALAGAGAGLGATSQTVGDNYGHGRTSSVSDVVGAAIGGGIGSLSLIPFGPARAGAIGAAATSIAQDVLNDRPVDYGDAGKGAILGNVLGGAAGDAGLKMSKSMSPKAKGELGEALGDLRSRINLEPREWTPKTAEPAGRGLKWIPDGRRGEVRLEDKFGVSAKLSTNQKLARAKLGENFVLNHFLPADIGKLFGGPAAAVAPQVVNSRRPQP
jgi:hypothetical protein